MQGKHNQQADRPRILVVDNDEAMALAICVRLESLGFICVTAETGERGLEEYGDQEIQLIITDLNMPAIDGVEFIKTLRRKHKKTPVIVITGYSREYSDRISTLRNLAVVHKPIDMEYLVDLVDMELAMQGKRLIA